MKSGLSKLIDYAMNPSKTTADKSFNDGMKNEEVVFVRGINCTPEFAKAQMQETKNRFNKNTGNVGYHIIQSFDDNEGANEQVLKSVAGLPKNYSVTNLKLLLHFIRIPIIFIAILL